MEITLPNSQGNQSFRSVAGKRSNGRAVYLGDPRLALLGRSPVGVEKSALTTPCPVAAGSVFSGKVQDYLLTMCRRIRGRPENRGITYCLGSFPFPESYFDENGLFCTSDPRYGLNCSTFVVRVFESGKYPLVRIEGWPRRQDDIPCQQWLVGHLERALRTDPGGSITQAKVDFAQSQIGCPRIRPPETAGACLEPRGSLPIGVALCEPNGDVIHAILRRVDAEVGFSNAVAHPCG